MNENSHTIHIFVITHHTLNQMARTSQFNKETIIKAGLQLVRKEGEAALTARALGSALGCSTSPLFTVCGSFEEIKKLVRAAAVREFTDYVKDSVNYVPAFKEFGMRLVKFSINEPNLYKMIFLTPDVTESHTRPHGNEVMEDMKKHYELSDEQVHTLVDQVWTYACGLSALCISGVASFTDEEISNRLSMQFISTIMLIKSGVKTDTMMPRLRKEGEGSTMPLPDKK